MAPTPSPALVQSWNTTLEDTSPLLTYFPCDDSGSCSHVGRWNTSYSNGTLYQNGFTWGTGASTHTTSGNASVSFNVTCTDVWFFGSATGMVASVLVDGTSVPVTSNPKSNVLASVRNLSDGPHTITLQTTFAKGVSSGSVSLESINFTTSARYYGGNLKVTQVLSTDGTISYNGFRPVTIPQVNNGSTMFESRVAGDVATYGFTGTGVYLYGMQDADHGQYEVSIDGVPARRLSGISRFAIPNGLLYFAGGLDGTAQHTLSVKNLESKPLDINAIRVVRTSGGTPASEVGGPSRGLIAGSIVLALVGALALLATIWFLWRRRLGFGLGSAPPVPRKDRSLVPYALPASQGPAPALRLAIPHSVTATMMSTSSGASSSVTPLDLEKGRVLAGIEIGSGAAAALEKVERDEERTQRQTGFWKGGRRYSTRDIIVVPRTAPPEYAPPEYAPPETMPQGEVRLAEGQSR